MGQGRWSRWGRGSCEGYTLEFGSLFRADIVRGQESGATGAAQFAASYPHSRRRSVDTVEEAGAWIEGQLAFDMKRLLEDWAKFKPGQAKRRSGGRH